MSDNTIVDTIETPTKTNKVVAFVKKLKPTRRTVVAFGAGAALAVAATVFAFARSDEADFDDEYTTEDDVELDDNTIVIHEN